MTGKTLRDKLRCSPVSLHQGIILCIPLDHHFWQRFMAIALAFAAKHVDCLAHLRPHWALLQHILVPIVDIADGFWLKSPFAQKINKCFTEETIRDQLVRSQQA
jgi:hypothetical protein